MHVSLSISVLFFVCVKSILTNQWSRVQSIRCSSFIEWKYAYFLMSGCHLISTYAYASTIISLPAHFFCQSLLFASPLTILSLSPSFMHPSYSIGCSNAVSRNHIFVIALQFQPNDCIPWILPTHRMYEAIFASEKFARRCHLKSFSLGCFFASMHTE